MKRKILALFLSVTMLTMGLTGCGGGGQAEEQNNAEAVAAADEVQQDREVQKEEDVETASEEQEMITLNIVFVNGGVSSEVIDRVQEEINKELIQTCNAQIEILDYSASDWENKVSLALASGEKIDLFEVGGQLASLYANDYLMPLDAYLDNCPDILELLGPYADMTQINGVTYGLPSLKDETTDYCIMFRKDILQEAGIEPGEGGTIDELEEILTKLKAKYPDKIILCGNATTAPLYYDGGIEYNSWCDPLGDYLGVLMNPTESLEVTNYYASDSYRTICEYAYRMHANGLIGFDELLSESEMMKADRALAIPYGYTPKSEAEASASVGYDLQAWRLLPEGNPLASTQNNWSWAVNADCEYPERALQVLNQMFISKNINNLLAWGIEGEHYEMVDEEQGIIRYPEGSDSTNIEYYQWTKFSYPNNFLQYIMEGNDPQMWAKTNEFNLSADFSLAMGFFYDSSEVATQIAACTNVVNEYKGALCNGLLDPETELPKFIQKLEEAGINDIIAAKQEQLDAWAAAKD